MPTAIANVDAKGESSIEPDQPHITASINITSGMSIPDEMMAPEQTSALIIGERPS